MVAKMREFGLVFLAKIDGFLRLGWVNGAFLKRYILAP